MSGRSNKTKRRPWSTAEKQAVFYELSSFIRQKKVPGKTACEETIEKHPEALSTRDWRGVKNFVYNHIKHC